MGSKSDCWIELQILPLEGYMKIMFLLFTSAENRKCDSGEEAIVQVLGTQPNSHRVLWCPAGMAYTWLCFK